MNRFDQLIGHLLGSEGGFVYDPDDHGGATKWGITLRFYQQYMSHTAGVEEIRNLTRSEAKEAYRIFFWQNPNQTVRGGYDLLPEGVDYMVLNSAVNMGWDRSHKLLQQALRELGHSIKVDGWIGPVTRRAVDQSDPAEVVKRMGVEMCKFYSELVYVQNYGAKFFDGWLYRATSAVAFASKMM